MPCPQMCISLKPAASAQVRRAGAVAVSKAVADKAQLELLDLDGNEISDSAIDDIKVHQVCIHDKGLLISYCSDIQTYSAIVAVTAAAA